MKNEEERLRYIGRFVPPTLTTSVLEAVAVFIAISPGRLAEGLEAWGILIVQVSQTVKEDSGELVATPTLPFPLTPLTMKEGVVLPVFPTRKELASVDCSTESFAAGLEVPTPTPPAFLGVSTRLISVSEPCTDKLGA